MEQPRVVFMGSPAPAVSVLRAVQDLGWEVVAVYTTPDRPSGRGRRMESTPVKQYAVAHQLPVYQPQGFRAAREQECFRALAPGLVVLAAYGKLLSPPVLETPRWGCLNVHPSLLPRHRGATPVASAILEGDAVAGATLFLMDEGLDTGPIIAARETKVLPKDTTPALTGRLFELGAELLTETLPRYVAGEVQPVPQPAYGATSTGRLTKDAGEIAWQKPAVRLEREVRAYLPWPGSVTWWLGKRLQVLEASAEAWSGESPLPSPGTVVGLADRPQRVGVVTGDGVLVLEQVKLEGRPAMATQQFLQGHPDFLGSELPGYPPEKCR